MRHLVMVAAAVALTGCWTASTPFGESDGAARTISIEVVNLNFNQATIYAVGLGERIRLGVVEGKQTRRFTARWSSAGGLRLEMRLLGGRRCVTREISVAPGDELYLEVPANVSGDPDCAVPAGPSPVPS